MTAEPDALRLVLTRICEAQEKHRGDGTGLHLAMISLCSEARSALAAAPAVQPAAGREESVASGLTKAQRSLLFGIMRTGYGQTVEPWTKAHDALLDRGLIRINEYRIGFYKAYPTDTALALFGNPDEAALSPQPGPAPEGDGE